MGKPSRPEDARSKGDGRGENEQRINLSVIREPGFAEMTPRKREVCWRFGIPPREAPFTIAPDLAVTLRPGSIILLSGPSGSGKSTLLNKIAQEASVPIWVGRGRFPANRAVVDAIDARGSLSTALEILTACGLGEPRLWVRQYTDLSDGERFRAGLARAVGTAFEADHKKCTILCDEFSAILHRRAAKAVAYNLRKLVTRHGLRLVVATTHEDIVDDLQPDQAVALGAGPPAVIDRTIRKRSMSLRRRVMIERGTVRDYRFFAPMHYRHRDGLGFVDKVFLLKERGTGDPLGILVFAHAPMELSLRNRSTSGRFTRNVRRLNRELRILRRLVMHPDVRGCGLGHHFVHETLPQVGVRFVECLAAMGEVNPVFERAGMHRVGRCPLPKGRLKLLDRMKQWNLDPFASDFPKRIARCPRVRALVEDTVQDWVKAMHGKSRYDVHGRPPGQLCTAFRQLLGSPPVYYLWDRKGRFPIPQTEEKHCPDQKAAAGSKADRLSNNLDTRQTTARKSRHRPESQTPVPRRTRTSKPLKKKKQSRASHACPAKQSNPRRPLA